MDEFYPSEIARLVLGYLIEENYNTSWQTFLQESSLLKEHYHLHKQGKSHPTNVNGKSLLDILNEYCALKKKAEENKGKNSQNSAAETFVTPSKTNQSAYARFRVNQKLQSVSASPRFLASSSVNYSYTRTPTSGPALRTPRRGSSCQATRLDFGPDAETATSSGYVQNSPPTSKSFCNSQPGNAARIQTRCHTDPVPSRNKSRDRDSQGGSLDSDKCMSQNVNNHRVDFSSIPSSSNLSLSNKSSENNAKSSCVSYFSPRKEPPLVHEHDLVNVSNSNSESGVDNRSVVYRSSEITASKRNITITTESCSLTPQNLGEPPEYYRAPNTNSPRIVLSFDRSQISSLTTPMKDKRFCIDDMCSPKRKGIPRRRLLSESPLPKQSHGPEIAHPFASVHEGFESAEFSAIFKECQIQPLAEKIAENINKVKGNEEVKVSECSTSYPCLQDILGSEDIIKNVLEQTATDPVFDALISLLSGSRDNSENNSLQEFTSTKPTANICDKEPNNELPFQESSQSAANNVIPVLHQDQAQTSQTYSNAQQSHELQMIPTETHLNSAPEATSSAQGGDVSNVSNTLTLSHSLADSPHYQVPVMEQRTEFSNQSIDHTVSSTNVASSFAVPGSSLCDPPTNELITNNGGGFDLAPSNPLICSQDLSALSSIIDGSVNTSTNAVQLNIPPNSVVCDQSVAATSLSVDSAEPNATLMDVGTPLVETVPNDYNLAQHQNITPIVDNFASPNLTTNQVAVDMANTQPVIELPYPTLFMPAFNQVPSGQIQYSFIIPAQSGSACPTLISIPSLPPANVMGPVSTVTSVPSASDSVSTVLASNLVEVPGVENSFSNYVAHPETIGNYVSVPAYPVQNQASHNYDCSLPPDKMAVPPRTKVLPPKKIQNTKLKKKQEIKKLPMKRKAEISPPKPKKKYSPKKKFSKPLFASTSSKPQKNVLKNNEVPRISIPESPCALQLFSKITNTYEIQSPDLKRLVSSAKIITKEGGRLNNTHVRCIDFGSEATLESNKAEQEKPRTPTRRSARIQKQTIICQPIEKSPELLKDMPVISPFKSKRKSDSPQKIFRTGKSANEATNLILSSMENALKAALHRNNQKTSSQVIDDKELNESSPEFHEVSTSGSEYFPDSDMSDSPSKSDDCVIVSEIVSSKSKTVSKPSKSAISPRNSAKNVPSHKSTSNVSSSTSKTSGTGLKSVRKTNISEVEKVHGNREKAAKQSKSSPPKSSNSGINKNISNSNSNNSNLCLPKQNCALTEESSKPSLQEVAPGGSNVNKETSVAENVLNFQAESNKQYTIEITGLKYTPNSNISQVKKVPGDKEKAAKQNKSSPLKSSNSGINNNISNSHSNDSNLCAPKQNVALTEEPLNHSSQEVAPDGSNVNKETSMAENDLNFQAESNNQHMIEITGLKYTPNTNISEVEKVPCDRENTANQNKSSTLNSSNFGIDNNVSNSHSNHSNLCAPKQNVALTEEPLNHSSQDVAPDGSNVNKETSVVENNLICQSESNNQNLVEEEINVLQPQNTQSSVLESSQLKSPKHLVKAVKKSDVHSPETSDCAQDICSLAMKASNLDYSPNERDATPAPVFVKNNQNAAGNLLQETSAAALCTEEEKISDGNLEHASYETRDMVHRDSLQPSCIPTTEIEDNQMHGLNNANAESTIVSDSTGKSSPMQVSSGLMSPMKSAQTSNKAVENSVPPQQIKTPESVKAAEENQDAGFLSEFHYSPPAFIKALWKKYGITVETQASASKALSNAAVNSTLAQPTTPSENNMESKSKAVVNSVSPATQTPVSAEFSSNVKASVSTQQIKTPEKDESKNSGSLFSSYTDLLPFVISPESQAIINRYASPEKGSTQLLKEASKTIPQDQFKEAVISPPITDNFQNVSKHTSSEIVPQNQFKEAVDSPPITDNCENASKNISPVKEYTQLQNLAKIMNQDKLKEAVSSPQSPDNKEPASHSGSPVKIFAELSKPEVVPQDKSEMAVNPSQVADVCEVASEVTSKTKEYTQLQKHVTKIVPQEALHLSKVAVDSPQSADNCGNASKSISSVKKSSQSLQPKIMPPQGNSEEAANSPQTSGNFENASKGISPVKKSTRSPQPKMAPRDKSREVSNSPLRAVSFENISKDTSPVKKPSWSPQPKIVPRDRTKKVLNSSPRAVSFENISKGMSPVKGSTQSPPPKAVPRGKCKEVSNSPEMAVNFEKISKVVSTFKKSTQSPQPKIVSKVKSIEAVNSAQASGNFENASKSPVKKSTRSPQRKIVPREKSKEVLNSPQMNDSCRNVLKSKSSVEESVPLQKHASNTSRSELTPKQNLYKPSKAFIEICDKFSARYAPKTKSPPCRALAPPKKRIRPIPVNSPNSSPNFIVFESPQNLSSSSFHGFSGSSNIFGSSVVSGIQDVDAEKKSSNCSSLKVSKKPNDSNFKSGAHITASPTKSSYFKMPCNTPSPRAKNSRVSSAPILSGKPKAMAEFYKNVYPDKSIPISPVSFSDSLQNSNTCETFSARRQLLQSEVEPTLVPPSCAPASELPDQSVEEADLEVEEPVSISYSAQNLNTKKIVSSRSPLLHSDVEPTSTQLPCSPAFAQPTSATAFAQPTSETAFAQPTSATASAQQTSATASAQQPSATASAQQTSATASAQQPSAIASAQQTSVTASAWASPAAQPICTPVSVQPNHAIASVVQDQKAKEVEDFEMEESVSHRVENSDDENQFKAGQIIQPSIGQTSSPPKIGDEFISYVHGRKRKLSESLFTDTCSTLMDCSDLEVVTPEKDDEFYKNPLFSGDSPPVLKKKRETSRPANSPGETLETAAGSSLKSSKTTRSPLETVLSIFPHFSGIMTSSSSLVSPSDPKKKKPPSKSASSPLQTPKKAALASKGCNSPINNKSPIKTVSSLFPLLSANMSSQKAVTPEKSTVDLSVTVNPAQHLPQAIDSEIIDRSFTIEVFTKKRVAHKSAEKSSTYALQAKWKTALIKKSVRSNNKLKRMRKLSFLKSPSPQDKVKFNQTSPKICSSSKPSFGVSDSGQHDPRSYMKNPKCDLNPRVELKRCDWLQKREMEQRNPNKVVSRLKSPPPPPSSGSVIQESLYSGDAESLAPVISQKTKCSDWTGESKNSKTNAKKSAPNVGLQPSSATVIQESLYSGNVENLAHKSDLSKKTELIDRNSSLESQPSSTAVVQESLYCGDAQNLAHQPILSKKTEFSKWTGKSKNNQTDSNKSASTIRSQPIANLNESALMIKSQPIPDLNVRASKIRSQPIPDLNESASIIRSQPIADLNQNESHFGSQLKPDLNENATSLGSNLPPRISIPESPVRSDMKSQIYKTALSQKTEKNPTIPLGVKIPSKWNSSKITRYSDAIMSTSSKNKKSLNPSNSKQVRRSKPSLKIATIKSPGKLSEEAKKQKVRNKNKAKRSLSEKNSQKDQVAAVLNLSAHSSSRKSTIEARSEDSYTQRAVNPDSSIDKHVDVQSAELNVKKTYAMLTKERIKNSQPPANKYLDHENTVDLVESDIGRSNEEGSELSKAIAFLTTQLSPIPMSPKKIEDPTLKIRLFEDPMMNIDDSFEKQRLFEDPMMSLEESSEKPETPSKLSSDPEKLSALLNKIKAHGIDSVLDMLNRASQS